MGECVGLLQRSTPPQAPPQAAPQAPPQAPPHAPPHSPGPPSTKMRKSDPRGSQNRKESKHIYGEMCWVAVANKPPVAPGAPIWAAGLGNDGDMRHREMAPTIEGKRSVSILRAFVRGPTMTLLLGDPVKKMLQKKRKK